MGIGYWELVARWENLFPTESGLGPLHNRRRVTLESLTNLKHWPFKAKVPELGQNLQDLVNGLLFVKLRDY